MANTLFKSQTQQDLGVIRAKLDMAEARLAQLERDAPAASLRLHLGTAQDGDADLVAQLPIARDERDQLVLALGAAEQLEADRKSAARHKALGSKVRAGQQHLSRIERSMHAVEAAAANMISALARAVDSTRGVYALFPHLHMDNITPGRLGRLAQAALVNA